MCCEHQYINKLPRVHPTTAVFVTDSTDITCLEDVAGKSVAWDVFVNLMYAVCSNSEISQEDGAMLADSQCMVVMDSLHLMVTLSS